jgi:hypothetical protein
LHEKIVELRSCIVSLEADLKVPIPTSCSTSELHAVKNLDLAKCVGRLQDENDKLREALSWLSSQEPQLGIMIASCKHFDGWTLGLDKVGEGSGDREGKFGNVSVPPQPIAKESLHPSQTNQEKNRVRRQVKSLVRNQVRSLVKSLIPSLSLDQSISIVSFVERMVTRERFASRGSVRREWRRSALTRTSTTLPKVYLSLVCNCPGPRRV